MICRHRELQQGLSSISLQRYFVLVGCTHQVFTSHKSCLSIPSFSIWFKFEIKAGVVTLSRNAISCESSLQHRQLPWTLLFLGFGNSIFPFVFLVVLHVTHVISKHNFLSPMEEILWKQCICHLKINPEVDAEDTWPLLKQSTTREKHFRPAPNIAWPPWTWLEASRDGLQLLENALIELFLRSFLLE